MSNSSRYTKTLTAIIMLYLVFEPSDIRIIKYIFYYTTLL